MSKKFLLILAVIVIGLGGYLLMNRNHQPLVDTSVAKAGEHCGGNMTTAKTCEAGYHCAPEANSHLPFGDVGGICVAD